MKKIAIFGLLFVALLVIMTGAGAQDAADTSGVEILWPPPVSEVWGSGEVIGTASVADMAYYYLEYMPLNDDLSFPDNAPWIPATIGIETAVVNDALATLDTSEVSDGLYALRLVVNTQDGHQYTDTVMPIRVSNERFDRVIEEIVTAVQGENGIEPTAEPTAEPTTAPVDNTPRVTPSAASVNIRRCDLVDNYRCSVVGYLIEGDSATILGLSANGSGWYQVQLPSGLIGWVSPTVVVVSGNTSSIPPVAPPAPLAPTQVAPTPGPTSNIVPNGIAIQGTPTCSRAFNVQVNIANTGSVPSPAGTISIQDVNVSTGEITFSTYGSYPSINPGGNYVVVISVTSSVYYDQRHELRAYAGNQVVTTRYTLQRGNCSGQTNPTPTPNPNQREFGPNECFLVLTERKPVYDAPYGDRLGRLDPASYEARLIRRVDGANWFRLDSTPLGRVWIAGSGNEKQGDCGLRDS
jgi:hypothetical protein